MNRRLTFLILTSIACLWCASATVRAADTATSQPTSRPVEAPPQDAAEPAVKVPPQWAAKSFLPTHEKFVERAKQGNVDVLFLGDSITEMWAGKGKSVWDQHYASLNTANFGIGGDRTQHVLWRVLNGELDGISPKVVVLLIGTNNTGVDPPERVALGVEKIVGVIKEKCPTAKVVLMAVFPRAYRGDVRNMDDIRTINQRIAKLDDGKTVRFLDINDKLAGPDGKPNKELFLDNLHINAKGYEIWADALDPVLKELTSN